MKKIELALNEVGFDGLFFPVEGSKKAIIVVCGLGSGLVLSEKMAQQYQRMGYSALALGLYKTKYTPANYVNIPLEYMEMALLWLKDEGIEKVFVDGLSKASEYVLYAASKFDTISGVIVRSPNYYVSEGMMGTQLSGGSSIQVNGHPVNYSSFVQRDIKALDFIASGVDLNVLSYFDKVAIKDNSIIQIEKINGPILMIYSLSDTVFPAQDNVQKMIERLKTHDFSHPFDTLCVKYASHLLLSLDASEMTRLKLAFKSERQNPVECNNEREIIKEKTKDFLEKYF